MQRYNNQIRPEDIQLELNGPTYRSDIEVLNELKSAMNSKKVLTGYCESCDEECNLSIRLSNNIIGIIKREEVTYKVEQDGLVHKKKCQYRVGLKVPFMVKELKQDEDGNIIAYLSRKDAMLEVRKRYAKELKVGDIVDGVVIGMQDYAAWIDIGGDVTGIINRKNITRVPIKTPAEKLTINQRITVMVSELEVKEDGDIVISFSRKELLPDMDEIDKYYTEGTIVLGRVKNIKDSGIYVELNESYEGMAEFVPGMIFKYGQPVRVRINYIDKSRGKIKLRIII